MIRKHAFRLIEWYLQRHEYTMIPFTKGEVTVKVRWDGVNLVYSLDLSRPVGNRIVGTATVTPEDKAKLVTRLMGDSGY